jgi:hypothetical protein
MIDDRDVLEREMAQMRPRPIGLDDLIRRRERKNRRQRIAAGVVAIAIFTAPAAWFVATGGPSDRTQTPATTEPTISPAPTGVGLIGLPPEGATPSTPRRGELLFGSMFGHTMGDPGLSHVYVYADGRLIWQRWADYTEGVEPTGLLERRLTPEGVELVMAEVFSTGLFDHDLNLDGAAGLYAGEIEVRNGDRLVHVNWGDVHPENVITETPTPEQVSALQRLDARLADPASWLPASAWEDSEIKAYVPSMYEVCYDAGRSGIGLSRVLDSFPQPAEDLLLTWDRTHDESVYMTGEAHDAYADIWCSDVATEEARALAQILGDAGIPESQELVGTHMVGYEVASGDVHVMVVVAPLLPHQP